MKLKKYLDDNGIIKTKFADRIGVSRETLYELFKDWADPRVSLVVGIERETNGAVTFKDWVQDEKA